MEFRWWLISFCGEDTPIGDLANDVAIDPQMPGGDDKDYIYRYLRSRGACVAALDAFEEAYGMYEHQKIMS